MSQTADIVSGNRFGWVDFAKGFCIVSVVMMWVDKILNLDSGWFHAYCRFALPFRMPDFFLISGLFLRNVIDRPRRSYFDTKVAHYLYFFVLWTLIYVVASWFKDWPSGPGSAFREIGRAFYHPIGNLWFISMLALFFLVTRATKAAPSLVMYLVAVALHLYPTNVGLYLVDFFGMYFVFFYTGYLFAPAIFSAAEKVADHRASSVLLLLIWGVGNWLIMDELLFRLGDHLFFSLLLRLLGIAAILTISCLVYRAWMLNWMLYLGRNSIVVYLGFYIPLNFIVYAASHFQINLRNSNAALIIWILTVLAALVPFWVLQGTSLRYLYVRPEWAKLGRGP